MLVAVQAALSRGVTLVQQVALAWLLAKSDFGLIGLAYTVTTLVTLMANPGVDTVLVQRLRRYRYWATPAFWLVATMGIVGCGVMLLLAPVAAWMYAQPRLIGLIAVLAIALPIQALQVVPKAQLQMQMRFRAIVVVGLLGSVLTAALTILFAYCGMKAYSFVVPVPIASAVVSMATWRLARPPIRRRLEFSRWKYIFGNSVTVGMTNLLNTFINQADYMALGLAGLSDATIGAYVFAFNIALQPLRLLSGNIPLVLFPGLSHLSLEPTKQVQAALRAMRLLTLVTVPVCLLQVLLAGPLFRVVFPPRWLDAVLPCQILTLGLMINAACWPAASLLLAQGRFREQLSLTAGSAIVFVGILTEIVLSHPSIVSIAIGVAVFHCFYSPAIHWLATHNYAPLGSFFRALLSPLLAGVVAIVPSVLWQACLPANKIGDLAAIGGGSLTFCAVYVFVVYLLVPASLHDLTQQVAPLWRRVRHGSRLPAVDTASQDQPTI